MKQAIYVLYCCSVCGFPGKESTSGMNDGSLTELTEVRVRVWKSYRTCRSSGYCVEVLCTKLTEVSAGYMNIVPVPVAARRYFTKDRVSGTSIYPGIYPTFRVFTLHQGRVRV